MFCSQIPVENYQGFRKAYKKFYRGVIFMKNRFDRLYNALEKRHKAILVRGLPSERVFDEMAKIIIIKKRFLKRYANFVKEYKKFCSEYVFFYNVDSPFENRVNIADERYRLYI